MRQWYAQRQEDEDVTETWKHLHQVLLKKVRVKPAKGRARRGPDHNVRALLGDFLPGPLSIRRPGKVPSSPCASLVRSSVNPGVARLWPGLVVEVVRARQQLLWPLRREQALSVR